MRPRIRSTRSLRLVTAAATIGAVFALPLTDMASAASPTVSVGRNPIGVAVNPSTNTVYVANFSDGSVSVVDGSTNTVTSTVSVGSYPAGVAVNPATNTVYVANYFSNSVSVINGSTNTVTSTVSVGRNPYAVAVNPSTNTVYVANQNDNSMSVIDGLTNTVTSTVSVGNGPYAVAVNPSTNTVYVSNSGDNSMSVIDGLTNTVTSTVSVGNGPSGVAVNPSTNTVYVANYSGNSMLVIDGSTNTVTSTVSVRSGPNGVAVNPSTNTIYVTNSGGNSMSVINGGGRLPQAPSIVSSSAGNSSVSVAWTAPSAGDAPILFYAIAANPPVGPAITTSVLASQLSATITGLTNSTTYSVTVTAVSSLGAGSPSSPASLTPTAVLPGAPTISSSSAGNSSASVAWSTPAAGDAPIFFYKLVATVGSSTVTTLYDASTNSATLNGLTNGTAYSLTVTAISSLGAGQASDPVSLTPRTVPTAPRSPKATAGTKKVTLKWSVPQSDGGSTITGYQIYMGKSAGHESPTPLNASLVTSLKYKATSLKQGKTYYFVIRAVNAAGMSASSVEVSATAK